MGDSEEVTVIERLVKPGDSIQSDQSLITVEFDKASMKIPSSHAGVVRELTIKLNDQKSKGSLPLTPETDGAGVAVVPS